MAQPRITFDVEPFLDAKVRFLRCAPEAEGGTEQCLLNLALNVRNSSAEDVAVTHVRVKVVGSSIAEEEMQQFAWIGRRNTGWYPLPASHVFRIPSGVCSLRPKVLALDFSDPVEVTLPLARHASPGGRVPLLGRRRGPAADRVLAAGNPVKAGMYLGQAGNSGSSSSPHMHIHSNRTNGDPVSWVDAPRPLTWMNARAVAWFELGETKPAAPWVVLGGPRHGFVGAYLDQDMKGIAKGIAVHGSQPWLIGKDDKVWEGKPTRWAPVPDSPSVKRIAIDASSGQALVHHQQQCHQELRPRHAQLANPPRQRQGPGQLRPRRRVLCDRHRCADRQECRRGRPAPDERRRAVLSPGAARRILTSATSRR